MSTSSHAPPPPASDKVANNNMQPKPINKDGTSPTKKSDVEPPPTQFVLSRQLTLASDGATTEEDQRASSSSPSSHPLLFRQLTRPGDQLIDEFIAARKETAGEVELSRVKVVDVDDDETTKRQREGLAREFLKRAHSLDDMRIYEEPPQVFETRTGVTPRDDIPRDVKRTKQQTPTTTTADLVSNKEGEEQQPQNADNSPREVFTRQPSWAEDMSGADFRVI